MLLPATAFNPHQSSPKVTQANLPHTQVSPAAAASPLCTTDTVMLLPLLPSHLSRSCCSRITPMHHCHCRATAATAITPKSVLLQPHHPYAPLPLSCYCRYCHHTQVSPAAATSPLCTTATVVLLPLLPSHPCLSCCSRITPMHHCYCRATAATAAGWLPGCPPSLCNTPVSATDVAT